MPDLATLHRRTLYATFLRHGFEPPFALFETSGEGRFLPMGTDDDPVEESSGYVLTRDGTVQNYWFRWDDEAGHPTLDLDLVEDADAWFDDYPEYHEARTWLGLA